MKERELFVYPIEQPMTRRTRKVLQGRAMSDIRARIRVGADRTISGIAPPQVPPGDHVITITVAAGLVRRKPHKPFDIGKFPVVDLGPWPEGISLRRADLYDDDAR